MKQVTFALGLIALGLALGRVIPGVFAQAPQAEVQKWEQFCEEHKPGDGKKKALEKANESAATHGKAGYQLLGGTSISGTLFLCYRRPAR